MDGVNTGVNTNLEDGIAIGLDAYQGPLDTPVWLDEAAAAPYGVTAGYYLFLLTTMKMAIGFIILFLPIYPFNIKRKRHLKGVFTPNCQSCQRSKTLKPPSNLPPQQAPLQAHHPAAYPPAP